MCKCKFGCDSRRCACLKNGQSCTDDCRCQQCQNPLNGMDTENLSMCLIQNIHAYKALSQTALDETYSLPCEHAEMRYVVRAETGGNGTAKTVIGVHIG